MKKILSITLASAMLVLSSCGDASENATKDAESSSETTSTSPSSDDNTDENKDQKSLCDCMEMSINDPNGNLDGCDWISEEYEFESYAIKQVMIDCPDILSEEMVESMQEESDAYDDYEAEMQKAQDEYDAEMNKAMKEYDAEMQKAMDEIDGM
jgi:hypothetical protein